MSRIASVVLVGLVLVGCVPPEPKGPHSSEATNGDVTCHEEAVTGSNMTRTVCVKKTTADADHQQQVNDMQRPHNTPAGGK